MIKIKEKHIGKSYIKSAIRKSIKHRKKLQQLYTKWPLTYEAHFKAYRNMLTKVIRAAKLNFYLNKLNIEADNSKKMLRTIDTILGRKKTQTTTFFCVQQHHN